MPPSRETVGFIGLGNMGRPMAASLARTGFEVVGSDADPDADFTRAVTLWEGKRIV